MSRIILFFVLLNLMSACANFPTDLQAPEAEVTRATLSDATLSDAIMVFNLKVKNPNDVPIKISKIEYDLNLNEKDFLKGVLDKGIEIPASLESNIEIPIQIAYKDIFRGVSQLVNQGTTTYQFDGKVHLGFWSVPVRRTGEIKLPDASALFQ